MAKKVLAVVLDRSNPNVKKRLEREYALYDHTSTFMLVNVEQHVTTDDVAEKAGIKGPNRDAEGIVFKLNAAYSGFSDKNLWEWLSDVM